MISVALEVVDPHKGLIRAPVHCPFKRMVLREVYPHVLQDSLGEILVIHASVCGVCGICTFKTGSSEVDGRPSLDDARQLVQHAISADQAIMASIMKQIRYLQIKDRSALVVLMSFEALQGVVTRAGYEGGELALNRVVSTDGPIGMIAGVPMYFSQLLTRSPVQVVGEVEWV